MQVRCPNVRGLFNSYVLRSAAGCEQKEFEARQPLTLHCVVRPSYKDRLRNVLAQQPTNFVYFLIESQMSDFCDIQHMRHRRFQQYSGL